MFSHIDNIFLKSVKRLFAENLIFLCVLGIFIFKLLPYGILSGNEQDYLVYAKHFINNNYIENDWYLNLANEYQYFFNLIAGPLALIFPLYELSIIGRLSLYTLYAYLIQKYSLLFNIKAYMIIPFLFLYLRYDNIVAGESMLEGFEMKCFAYFFILLAIYNVITNEYGHTLTFIFLGLSISFHILVGLYGTFCVVFICLIYDSLLCKQKGEIFKYLFVFVVAAAFGLYALIKNILLLSAGSGRLGGEIYVLKRNPHHLYPAYWVDHTWVMRLFILIGVLIIFHLIFKERKYRIISTFTFSSLSFFIIGLGLYKAGLIYLLKYYWFRFPDVVLPFFGCFAAAVLAQRALDQAKDRKGDLYKVARAGAIMGTCFLLLWLAAMTFTKVILHMQAKNNYALSGLDKNLTDMMAWIDKNTKKKAIFLVEPFNDQFYLGANRAILVSFKHVPTHEEDIIEWYNRMRLCNNGKEIVGYGFDINNEIKINYYHITEELLTSIVNKYHVDYFLTKKLKRYSFPITYQNGEYVLYSLQRYEQ